MYENCHRESFLWKRTHHEACGMTEIYRKEKMGDYKTTLEHYKRILQRNQNNPRIWEKTGTLYSRLEKTEKAIHCYLQAIKYKPSYELYYNLSMEYFKISKYEESLKIIQECIKLKPSFPSAYLMGAVITDRMASPDQAIDFLLKLLTKEPSHKGGLFALIMLYLKKDEAEKAAQYFKTLVSLGEKPTILNRLKVRLSLAQNNLTESIDLFNTLAGENPEIQKLQKSIREDIPDKAKKIISKKKNNIEKTINKNPQQWLDLSILSLFEGDNEKAMEQLKKAIQ